MSPSIVIGQTNAEVTANVKTYLEERLNYLQEQHGIISIGVSGGSMPVMFRDAVLAIENLDWKRIRVFMVDERNVDRTDPDSNHGIYKKIFPPEFEEYIMDVPICENVLKTAGTYEFLLRKYLLPEQTGQVARFDILLLGVGPDGHTCSIFPGHSLPKITEYNWVSAITESPKPPPARVTLTLPVLNAAKNVAFIITGKAKAPIVRGMYNGNETYPATLVRPFNKKLWYFLDAEAASELPSSATSSPLPAEEE